MSEKIYRIHPGIGIARVGNADFTKEGNPDRRDYFTAPLIPARNERKDPGAYKKQFPEKYKKDGKIKAQAAFFTIWEYEKSTNKPVREITLDEKDVESIGWNVHLTNKKADFFKFGSNQGEDIPNHMGYRNDIKKSYVMDPGPRKISGRNMGNKDQFKFKKGTSSDPSKEQWIENQKEEHQYLGELYTDDKGRLKVLGGKGIADTFIKGAKLKEAFNNKGWYDDVSDGVVEASITLKGGKNMYPMRAWVIVAPPDFAPEIKQPVTLFDLLSDVSVRSFDDKFLKAPMLKLYPHLKEIADDFKTDFLRDYLPSYKPHFHDDIYPILLNGFNMRFVHLETYAHHGALDVKNLLDGLNDNTTATKSFRELIFNRLRLPTSEGEFADVKKIKKGKKLDFSKIKFQMPFLYGDDFGAEFKPYLTLTRTQFECMRKWSEGDFIVSKDFTEVKGPVALDIASMENAIGGAFYPGTDIGWLSRNENNYTEPFRVDINNDDAYFDLHGKISPGYFTRQLAEPWHADFLSCAKDENLFYGFWPSQRPDDVLVKGKMTPWFRNDKGKFPGGFDVMVKKWYELGFVTFDPDSNEFIETERGSIK